MNGFLRASGRTAHLVARIYIARTRDAALATALSEAVTISLSMPTPCSARSAPHGRCADLDIGGGLRVGAGADRVLVVVEDGQGDAAIAPQRIDEGGDRAVADAFDPPLGPPSASIVATMRRSLRRAAPAAGCNRPGGCRRASR